MAKSVDLVLMVLDAGKEVDKNHREILERELRTAGLRINQTPPNIYFVCVHTRPPSLPHARVLCAVCCGHSPAPAPVLVDAWLVPVVHVSPFVCARCRLLQAEGHGRLPHQFHGAADALWRGLEEGGVQHPARVRRSTPWRGGATSCRG